MGIQTKWFYRLIYLLLLFIILYIFWKLKPIWLPSIKFLLIVLFPFICGAFITYLLHPIVEYLHINYLPRWLSILIIYTLFFGAIGVAVYKGIPAFVIQLRDLVDHVPEFADQYRQWIEMIQRQTAEWPIAVQERIDDGINQIETYLGNLLTKVIDGLMIIFNSIVLIALIPFIAFYMLKDIEKIKRTVWYLTPRKWRRSGLRLMRDIDESLGGYIRGQLFVSVLIGTLAALAFWFVKMKYPLLLGCIIGLTNVIPYFGPLIALIPTVVIAATISLKMMMISIAIVLVLQFIEGNILSPFIVGKSLELHPLMIMFALLAGEQMAGIIGLIIAVPILAIVKVFIIHGKNHFVRIRG